MRSVSRGRGVGGRENPLLMLWVGRAVPNKSTHLQPYTGLAVHTSAEDHPSTPLHRTSHSHPCTGLPTHIPAWSCPSTGEQGGDTRNHSVSLTQTYIVVTQDF